MRHEIVFTGAGGKRVVDLRREGSSWRAIIDGNVHEADVVEVAPNTFSILLDGKSYELRVTPLADGSLRIQSARAELVAQVVDPREWRGRHGALEVQGRQQVVAPMPGKIVRILVQAGETVEAGQGLVVVEAMKMQNEIRSPKSGKVEKIIAKEGETVNAGDVLVWVD